MTTVNLYRLYCVTEATNVIVWSDTTPTVCPNNNTHTIDTGSITVIQTVSTDQTTVLEPNNGPYQGANYAIDIPAGATGDVTNVNISWPYQVYLKTTSFKPQASMVGDELTIIIAPDSTVGFVTSNISISDTIITVSPSVTPIVLKGYEIKITDGVNTNNMGRILAINTSTNQLTMEFAATNNFTAGITTLVKLNIYVVKNWVIDQSTEMYKLGEKGFASRQLPANIVMRVSYKNNTTTAKKWYWNIELNYGL